VSRYRLMPTPAQETILAGHCAHARFIWNLAVEQQSWWRPGRGTAPGYGAQGAQLTEARATFGWLRDGSQMVQQQALRDFAQAMANYFAGTHRKPTWRKVGRNEGFRIVAIQPTHIQRLSRKTGEVRVPKIGWVRFRWSRPVQTAKSYRITLDRAGRWHIAFTALPDPISAPGTGAVVGIDRGVAVSAALSTGKLLRCPSLRPAERARLRRLQRKLARARKGSNRRRRVKTAVATMKAREVDRRTDWAEKASTDLARRFDVIRVEDLRIASMTRSAKGMTGQPWHLGQRVGPAGTPTGGQGTRPGRENQFRLHEPAMLGVRPHRSGEPREPSSLPLRGLRIHRQRGCECGIEHRRRACGDCAGTLAAGRADEP